MKGKINIKSSIVQFGVLFFLFIIPVKGQNTIILKDSVQIDKTFYVLEELKINTANTSNTAIYKILQSTYDIFDKPYIALPEQRIKAKKDTLSAYIAENTLRESNYGFEHYEVYYDKNDLLNVSIGIQSYGSPWETVQYFCFDLKTGENTALKFFNNQAEVLKIINKKLKQQEVKMKARTEDLVNFKIVQDNHAKITGLEFSVSEVGEYRNSGYQQFPIFVSWREINKYIMAPLKKRLL
ncbi:hypothetical protein NJT12_23600 [Flavobacterium sp. AC]|uniref:Deacetylase PdaC domain-containing protein n=1 Tax=Flavobacterium azizsancarii TaxID=2961580 RepID=A0ABT4WJH5_9FLAO|nr:hypothetical protein [Flavobacterium azizsancarii]MDA6072611.1 hypothetical protein [Flavobacterium azizsancarii]